MKIATQRDHVKVVEDLIETGADVDWCNLNLYCCSPKILRVLFRAGVKITEGWDFTSAVQNLADLALYVDVNNNYKPGDIMHISNDDLKETARLLYAAGETLDESRVKRPDFLQFETQETNLMTICRRKIRQHLLQMSSVNLFYRMPRLGLPDSLCKYLLYNVGDLDDENKEDGKEGQMRK